MAQTNLPSSSAGQQYQQSVNPTAFATVTFLFFMWGFLTCMNDILIPYLKEAFELSYTQAMLVQFAFFGAYFIGSVIYFAISVKFGDPIVRIGYKNGIIGGLLIAAVACALFYPAAHYHIYALFLGALFLLGLGFTLLQIAANPYVAILGPAESAPSRLNLSQGFNSFGTTIAPLIGGYLIFQVFNTPGTVGSDAVQVPYLVFASVFALMALVIKLTNLPKVAGSGEIESGAGALRYPQLIFGMLAIFFYVGAEVTIGSLLINFFRLEHIGGLAKEEADIFLSFYWGGAMIGRFLGAISLSAMAKDAKKLGLMVLVAFAAFGFIYVAAWLKSGQELGFAEVAPFGLIIAVNLAAFVLGQSMAGRTLGIFSIACVALVLLTIGTEGQLAFWAIIGVGLFNSIMWSNIFTLAIDGLGKHTSQGSSLLVMAILGGALLPLLQGLMADLLATPENPDAGIQVSFIIPALSYLYIMWYGFVGHKKRPKTTD